MDGPLSIPPRRLTANDWPRANDWNKLADHVYRATGGGTEFDPAMVQELASSGRILARIVASDPSAFPCPYAWRQIVRQFNASFVDHPYSAGGGVADDGGGFPAYESSGNPHVPVDGTAVVWLTPDATGGSYFTFDWAARPVWASLTGSSGALYAWTEQYPTAGGDWDDLPGGMTGTTTQNAARELYGVTGLANGTIVQLSRGYSSGAPQAIVGRVRAGDESLSEKQSLSIVGATAGTYTLTFEEETTAAIAWNANAAAIEAALEALANLTDVAVSGTGDPDGDPWVIEFLDDFAPHAIIQAEISGLKGDQEWLFAATGIVSLNGLTAKTQTFSTGTSGVNFNISSVTDDHKFNIPDADSVANSTPSLDKRGLVNTGEQWFAGHKVFPDHPYFASNLIYIGGWPSIGGTLKIQASRSLPEQFFFELTGASTNLYTVAFGEGTPRAFRISSTGVTPVFSIVNSSGVTKDGVTGTGGGGDIITGGLITTLGSGYTLAIGSTISGSTSNGVLYVGAGALAQSADFTWDNTAKTLTLANQGYLVTSRTTAPSGIPSNTVAGPFTTT